jgi:hypothetical protein
MADGWLETASTSADLYPDNVATLKDYAVLIDSRLEKELWPPQ